jgi:hypothetical protein
MWVYGRPAGSTPANGCTLVAVYRSRSVDPHFRQREASASTS